MLKLLSRQKINPAFACNFAGGVLPPIFSLTRSSTAWNSRLESFAANQPIWEKDVNTGAVIGLGIRSSMTNLLLQSRDFTNAAWTKTSCTAAANQSGIDGVSNSACTLTATAINAVLSQSVTSASATRAASIYMKRKTGSGQVLLSTNGTTFTDISAQLSSTLWTRVFVTQAAVTNPVFAIKLATSGDEVMIDQAQLESSAIPTLPIITTATQVTAGRDVYSANAAAFGFNETEGTIVLGYRCMQGATGALAAYFEADTGSSTDRYLVGRSSASVNTFLTVAGNVNQCNITNGAVASDADIVSLNIYKTNQFYTRTNLADFAGDDTSGSLPTGITIIRLGSTTGSTFDVILKKLAYFNKAISKAEASKYL